MWMRGYLFFGGGADKLCATDEEHGDASHVVSEAGIIADGSDGWQEDDIDDWDDDVDRDLGIPGTYVEEHRHPLACGIRNNSRRIQDGLRDGNGEMNDTDADDCVHQYPRPSFRSTVCPPTK
jgi:hypothetical protein